MQWAHQNKFGFTIVELLIVVVVIAILATITIVAYNGISQRAYLSSLQSDFRNAIQKLEAYKAETGITPNNTVNDLRLAGVQINKDYYNTTANNYLYCVNTGTGTMGISAVGTNGVTYAQTTTRPFGVYTTVPITDFAGTCNDLVGSNRPIYGYGHPTWRSWVNP